MTNSVCYKIYGQDFHIEPESVQFANAVFHDEYRINDLRSHNVRTIVDVGSHVGSFTVMAHHYWPNAKIVAVEPHPQSFELMTKNTSHIPDSQLLRINAAISSKPGKCLLSFPVSNSRVADYVPDVWESLLARLDYAAGNWDWISKAWWCVHAEVATGESEDSGLGQLLADWDAEAQQPLECIKPANFEALVDYALGSPGVVVGRALHRHWSEAVSESGYFSSLSASWMGLRNYLDQRWFYRLLCKGNESYPEALMRVVVDGNLESVLDEHLWIISRLRSLSKDELAIELQDGLTIKSGMFFLHPLQGKRDATFSLRCHVAMPFVQSRVKSLEEGEKPIRTDEMRRAFNTPFWPYVLATTSVGQEGLDFHAWCDTLVHWDLCRNPVDLEQREGRIQRFGGLSIRRAIAGLLAESAMVNRTDGESPWARIELMANETLSDDSGLAPWWVCKNGTVNRYVFDVPTSEQKHWLHWMKEQRLLYRLALGQPNQEDLVEILSSKVGLDPQSVREAVVNLSPWFRSSHG